MRDFGTFVIFSIIFIFLIILIEINSEEIEAPKEPNLSGFLQNLVPKTMSPEMTAIWNKAQIVGDLFKLKWQRILQVATAALGLGLVMLLKMFLLWVGPYLASAPVRAFRDAIAQEASRELLSNAVMKGVSTLQSLYG